MIIEQRDHLLGPGATAHHVSLWEEYGRRPQVRILGTNGTNDVLSFLAPSAIGSWNFDVMDFARQAVARGLAQNNWYLTSVQEGSSTVAGLA